MKSTNSQNNDFFDYCLIERLLVRIERLRSNRPNLGRRAFLMREGAGREGEPARVRREDPIGRAISFGGGGGGDYPGKPMKT